ncbi:MAG: hypothetical protein AAF590_09585 [Pseudomonadota bacterium]
MDTIRAGDGSPSGSGHFSGSDQVSEAGQVFTSAKVSDRASLDEYVALVLSRCDLNKLARLLGLTSVRAAEVFLAHPSCKNHLAIRLAEACHTLPLDKAENVLQHLIGDAAEQPMDRPL